MNKQILTSIMPLACLLITIAGIEAQSLPLEMRITPDSRLVAGSGDVEGLYNPAEIHKIELTFTEADWFELMDGEDRGPGNPEGTAGELLIGTLTFNDNEVLDSVVVGIKGQTSDFRNNSEKKSFSVDIDAHKNQDLLGYDNLNLNCGYEDPSGMREVLFYDRTRPFAPALKAAFIDLYINGQYWGPYANVQQIEGRYIGEWFIDNDGTRWRAVAPDDTAGPGGPPGGNRFGLGESTLNYNGADSTDYHENYTLKKTSVEDPWQDLIDACFQLNTLPTDELYDELKYYVDVDRALWFLAQEIVFTDHDSYVWKGGMDYYVYWDKDTDRLLPLEVDANSVLQPDLVEWSPFYNENVSDFVLMNRLFANDELRQRYLAHLRVVLAEHFQPTDINDRIDAFSDILDQRVQDDPKRIYNYNQFLTGVEEVREVVQDRYDFLTAHSEVNRSGLQVSDLVFSSANGMGEAPEGSEAVIVSVNIEDAQSVGIRQVNLYYASGYMGAFERTMMTDDNNDGTFEGTIPGFPASAYVRYYVEAIADSDVSTATFFPAGAEHDVYIYQVQESVVITNDVAINEIMASNDATASDETGEFDDWIELYNTTDEAISLEGYTLTDNDNNLGKWAFPEGTTINAGEYMIIWADDDEEQGALHTNFKLSADGEVVILVDPDGNIVNQIEFGEQTTDKSLARIPNGTGDPIIKSPTFGFNNEQTTSTTELAEVAISMYPNPGKDVLYIEHDYQQPIFVQIRDVLGHAVLTTRIQQQAALDISQLVSGTYFVQLGDWGQRTLVVLE